MASSRSVLSAAPLPRHSHRRRFAQVAAAGLLLTGLLGRAGRPLDRLSRRNARGRDRNRER
jgi:hypothetical protein